MLGITSVGPSIRKAYYSDYGVEQADLSAPGGDRRDFFGTSRLQHAGQHGAGAVPEVAGDRQRGAQPGRHAQHAVRAGRLLAAATAPTTSTCRAPRWPRRTRSGWRRWWSASRGQRDRAHGGLTLSPDEVERVLKRTAQDHAVPGPARCSHYPDPDLTPDYDGDSARGHARHERVLRRGDRGRLGGVEEALIRLDAGRSRASGVNLHTFVSRFGTIDRPWPQSAISSRPPVSASSSSTAAWAPHSSSST